MGILDRAVSALMRRGAMRDVGMGPIGASGTNIFSGLISEEYKPQLTGLSKWDTYQRMGSDGQVQSIRRAIALPTTSAEWFVTPNTDILIDGDKASSTRASMIADFILEAMWTIPHTPWTAFVGEAIEGQLQGVALFEKVLGRRADGMIVWEELGTRLPRTVDKWLTDPETGRFAGIHQLVHGDRPVDDDIPADRMLRMTFDQRGQNFEGVGLYRALYKHWWFIEFMERVFALSAERTGGGIPVINLPEGGNTRENRAAALAIIKAWRQGTEAGITLPHNFLLSITDIKLPTALIMAIDHHNAMMARAALAGFLTLGKTSAGSFALSKSGQDLFLMSLEAGVETIRSVFQEHAVKELVHLNFGEDAPMPEVRYRINKADVLAQIEALEMASRSGIIVPDDNIEEVIREGLDVPGIDMDANRRERIAVKAPRADPEAGSYITIPGATRVAADPSTDPSDIVAHAIEDINPGDLVEIREGFAQVVERAPTLGGRGRIGDPLLAAEFSHDPTRDGSGTWRAFTSREIRFGFRGINLSWDTFTSALETHILHETDKAVASLTAKMRRAMETADINALLEVEFTRAFESALRKGYQEIGEEALVWSNKILADGAGIPPTDILAKERAWLKAAWNNQLARWMANVREELTRKVRRDPALREEMARGTVGLTTINRVLTGSRANYDAIKRGQLTATAKVAVGEAIHVGFNTTLRSDRVTLVQRSEVLDVNTCLNCARLDGEIFVKAEWPAIAPPHSCLGGALCRGVGIPILDDESPQPVPTPIESLPSLDQTRMSETSL